MVVSALRMELRLAEWRLRNQLKPKIGPIEVDEDNNVIRAAIQIPVEVITIDFVLDEDGSVVGPDG